MLGISGKGYYFRFQYFYYLPYSNLYTLKIRRPQAASKLTTMPDKIRVVIVDDHQVIRTSWKILFGTDERFDVVAVFKSGEEAIEAVPALEADVILMDINMFPLNGFDTTSRLLQIDPGIRVIGISANNYPGYAQKMISLGARGFVTKSSPFEELTTAVWLVSEGETYICEEISRLMEN